MNRFWEWLAWRLPRKLVYWCMIRVAVHATTGPWSGEESPAVTYEKMAKRWHTDPTRAPNSLCQPGPWWNLIHGSDLEKRR